MARRPGKKPSSHGSFFGDDKACICIILIVSLATSGFFGQCFPVSDDGLRAIIMAGEFSRLASEGFVDMYKPYIGVNLFLVPSVAMFGPTREVFKASQTLFTVLTAMVTFFVAKALFDRKTAFVSSVILAFMPMFIMIRWDEQQFLTFGFMVSLFLCLDFYRNQRRSSLYAAAFVLGVSTYVKLTTLYFIVAIVSSYLLLMKWKSVQKLRVPLNACLIAASFFILGSSPLILNNIQSGWQTASLLAEGPSLVYEGLKNVPMRVSQLFLAVEGFEQSYPLSNVFMPVVGFAAGIFLLSVMLGAVKKKAADIMLIISVAVFTFLSAFVPQPSPLRVMHLYYMLPFASMLIARFFIELHSRKSVLAMTLFAVMIFLNIANMWTAAGRLSDEGWIEENFQRAASVHQGFSQFLRNGDMLLLQGITIVDRNVDYLNAGGLDAKNRKICDSVKEYGRSIAVCNRTLIDECLHSDLDGRLVFIGVPSERASYTIYEEDCKDEGSICRKPLIVMTGAVQAAGKSMEKIGSVNDSHGLEAYSVYLIR